MIEIGYINANIAGDSRYTDTLKVYYDPATDTVKVIVTSTGALGGMDGPGGTTPAAQQYLQSSGPKPTGKVILKMVKDACAMDSFNFKRYGKPTKNFRWQTGEGWQTGLNSTLAQQALEHTKSE